MILHHLTKLIMLEEVYKWNWLDCRRGHLHRQLLCMLYLIASKTNVLELASLCVSLHKNTILTLTNSLQQGSRELYQSGYTGHVTFTNIYQQHQHFSMLSPLHQDISAFHEKIFLHLCVFILFNFIFLDPTLR